MLLVATKSGFTSMVSHRSGETSDTTISDLAVARTLVRLRLVLQPVVSVLLRTTASSRLRKSLVLTQYTLVTLHSRLARVPRKVSVDTHERVQKIPLLSFVFIEQSSAVGISRMYG